MSLVQAGSILKPPEPVGCSPAGAECLIAGNEGSDLGPMVIPARMCLHPFGFSRIFEPKLGLRPRRTANGSGQLIVARGSLVSF